ncbi:MAG: glycoside hydrolase family 2 TIM barrel-domain containing protein [Planctomycetota bacterium]
MSSTILRFLFLPVLGIPLCSIVADRIQAQSVVQLERHDSKWHLLRNGIPYPIHGVGGQSHLRLLAECGGNSIRTWSTDGLEKILDDAHQHGLTVCVGMWLGHERHGFSYQNEIAVTKQLEQCLGVVHKYKDHPAVLMWGIGNEMEGNGNNPAIWYAIDHIAREIHRVDPNHPTMTVIAELGESSQKVRSLERFCPNIDIVGINSYAGVASVGQRYRAAGGQKPYVLTEHGPRGPWEVEKTAWGAPIEASSTEKSNLYEEGYRSNVIDGSDLCLGSYAFLWGNKQETTATWFGMILPDGTRLAAVDALSVHWLGKPPQNRCPVIESLTLEGNPSLKPGEGRTLRLTANDPDGDSVRVKWVVQSDAAVVGEGGDAQAEEASIDGVIESRGMSAQLRAPESGGGYRVFAYALDDQGGGAVANIPWRVDAPMKSIEAPKAKLPFALYREGATAVPYAPSGFMGNASAIELVQDCTDEPHSGSQCIRISYQAPDAWGGVLWQSPENDWHGKLPGGLDLSGATVLEFWARGRDGGEVVSFVFGVVDGNTPYRDTSKGELREVKLSKEWHKYQIPLQGGDMSRIKTPFGWSLAGSGQPVTFYLDDIQYLSE